MVKTREGRPYRRSLACAPSASLSRIFSNDDLMIASSGSFIRSLMIRDHHPGSLRQDPIRIDIQKQVISPLWPQAQTFVHAEHRAEGLGVLAIGAAAGRTIELLAMGALEAHALVALSATAST